MTDMKPISYRLLAMIAFVLLIGALGVLARHFGSMEWLVDNETRLRGWVQQNPALVWFAGLAIYTAFSLVPGTSGKAIVFGWLFGFWQAVLMVDIALTLAAVISFLVARYLLRDKVQAKFKFRIEKLNDGLERDGVFYLLMMRLAHVPFTFVNYGTATTSVPLRTFAWTTLIGILPGTMVFVFVGTRIPTLAAIADKGAWELLDPFLLAVLAFAIVFPASVHWAIRHFDQRRRRRAKVTEIEPLKDDASGAASLRDSSGRPARGIH
jgi:uncharacterized membrane protein YdjX (TVP38/TMEM64 family)